MKKMSHKSAHTKIVKGTPEVGGNLKMKSPQQSIHIAQVKDNMAGNVGGGSHMIPSKQALGHQELVETGGGMKKPSKKMEKY